MATPGNATSPYCRAVSGQFELAEQFINYTKSIKLKDMATVLKSEKREFQEDPNKIDNYRLFSDVSRKKNGIYPKNLNFDLRLLNPGQLSAPYHFHRFAEELFMIISGSMTLRKPEGFEVVASGDLIFFEIGDSGKILIAPSFEIFKKDSQSSYFEGEKEVLEKWESIRSKNK